MKRALTVAVVIATLAWPGMETYAAKDPPTRPGAEVLRTLTETASFTLGRPTHLRFAPDGSVVLFLRSASRERSASLYELDVRSGSERLVISPEQLLGGQREVLSDAEKAARERKRITTAGFTSFELSADGERVLLMLSGKVWLVERKSGRAAALPIPAGTVLDARFSPQGDKVSFVRDHNLYVLEVGNTVPPKAAAIVALTVDGTEGHSHGTAEFVAQEEMQRFHGYWWAPDGQRIAYQSTDNAPVERLNIADAAHPESPALVFAYPRAGKANAVVRLSVSTVDARERALVSWDHAAYPYLARVAWSRNAPLSVLVQSRDQRGQAYLRVDPASGRTTVLHQEQDAAWLNLTTSTPRWLGDGMSYLWAAEHSGGWALERHWPAGRPGAPRPGGSRIEPVLDKSAGFLALVHVDEGRNLVWFLGTDSAPELHLFRAPLDRAKAPGLEPMRVSLPGGEHEATFAGNGSVFALARASLGEMARWRVFRTDEVLTGASPSVAVNPVPDLRSSLKPPGRFPSGAPAERKPTPPPGPWSLEVRSVAEEPSFRPNAELVPPERAGGFNALVLRPQGFDPKKRYPVVLHVYGGPAALMVRSTMAAYFLPQWIAEHGFVVVSLDGRGTPRRGREFERAIKGKFGSVPLDDQVAGLRALAQSYPELDLARVGVYGWSFGGYMAALAVLRRPDVFKVAVAGAPVVDWLYYDTHYTERYLGLPDLDPEAYAASSLLSYAPKLERPLLLVHGIADDNVYFAHTLQLADALFRHRRPFDLLPLVGLTHQVADPAVREALQERIVRYLGAALW